jgi:hypothetical protein
MTDRHPDTHTERESERERERENQWKGWYGESEEFL